jgi:hypothetical protein
LRDTVVHPSREAFAAPAAMRKQHLSQQSQHISSLISPQRQLRVVDP